jgi:hypothetical protein
VVSQITNSRKENSLGGGRARCRHSSSWIQLSSLFAQHANGLYRGIANEFDLHVPLIRPVEWKDEHTTTRARASPHLYHQNKHREIVSSHIMSVKELCVYLK